MQHNTNGNLSSQVFEGLLNYYTQTHRWIWNHDSHGNHFSPAICPNVQSDTSIEEVDDVQNGELHKLWLACYLSGPGLGHWNTVDTMTLRVTRLWNARGEQHTLTRYNCRIGCQCRG